jgi:hypothetical protein
LAVGVSTGTLATTASLNATAVATGTINTTMLAIGVSTGTLATTTSLSAVSVATGAINTTLLAVAVSTGNLATTTSLNATAVATGTINTSLLAVAVSTGNFYTKTVSDATYAPRNSTDTVRTYVDATFIAKADVIYSTSSFSAVFVDTTAVNLVGLECVYRVSYDATLKSWYIIADATGSATVAVSTGVASGSGVTYGTAFFTPTLSTQQYATGSTDGVTIPRGYYIKFVVLTCTTSKGLSINVEVWKRQ